MTDLEGLVGSRPKDQKTIFKQLSQFRLNVRDGLRAMANRSGRIVFPRRAVVA